MLLAIFIGKKHNLNLRLDFTSICILSYECMSVRALINEWLFTINHGPVRIT